MSAARRKAPDDKAFRAWLTSQGGQVLEPTNRWELARWRSQTGVQVIYTNKSGLITFNGPDCEEAWRAYLSGQSFPMVPTPKRRRKRSVVERTIVERDGPGCFYCGCPLTEERPGTLEHLVARASGGPEHLSNLYLACEPCNKAVGHQPAPVKIAYRDRLRARLQSEPQAQEVEDDQTAA